MDGALVVVEAAVALAAAGVLGALVRRDLRDRGAPGAEAGPPPAPPPYLVALCEGPRCVPVAVLAARQAEAEAALARHAARLRAAGAVGRVELWDRRDGRVVAARRVWP